MKKIYLLIIAVIFSNDFFGQAPSIQWQKILGGSNHDIAKSIKKTTDGGFIIAGRTYSHDGDVVGYHDDFDAWIVKLDSNANIKWQKTIGGSNYDCAESVQQTSDGGYIIAGNSKSNDGSIISTNNLEDFWVLRISSSGAIIWQKKFGGFNEDVATNVEQTSDGGYIVAGYTSSSNVIGYHGGSNDGYIVKLDVLGNTEWQKTFGGNADDQIFSIHQTLDGNFIASGTTNSINSGNVTANNGFYDAWIIKISSSGDLQWQKTYGGTGVELANSIIQSSDGGFVFAGRTSSNNGDVSGNHGASDFWVVKISNLGILEWQKSLGGFATDEAFCVQQTSDNGYIVAGYTDTPGNVFVTDDVKFNNGGNDYWITRLDSIGNLIWQKALGGNLTDIAYSVLQENDGGFVIAGFVSSNNGDVIGSQGNYIDDIWVIKLNPENLSNIDFTKNIASLSPNPTSDNFSIQLSGEKIIDKIEIYDLTGKIIFQRNGNFKEINTEKLNSGMYLINIFTTDNEKTACKFIKL